jgi:nucleoside-diphosphate-sugar epimerase
MPRRRVSGQKRFLVTGGTGYLGRALADRLQRGGHWVRILDVRTGDLFCEYIQGDILSEADVNNNRGAAPRCTQNRLHEHDQYTGYAPSPDAVGDEDTPYNWRELDISYMETKREAEGLSFVWSTSGIFRQRLSIPQQFLAVTVLPA